MNFLEIRAGETVEIGTQEAYRFWRYVFPPHSAPVRLLSWVSDKRWHPYKVVEGTTPDEGEQGIHGYKTMDDLMLSIRDPERLVTRSKISGCDGVAIGKIGQIRTSFLIAPRIFATVFPACGMLPFSFGR